jgi:uncharacterized protein with beta-barrel porin domain
MTRFRRAALFSTLERLPEHRHRLLLSVSLAAIVLSLIGAPSFAAGGLGGQAGGAGGADNPTGAGLGGGNNRFNGGGGGGAGTTGGRGGDGGDNGGTGGQTAGADGAGGNANHISGGGGGGGAHGYVGATAPTVNARGGNGGPGGAGTFGADAGGGGAGGWGAVITGTGDLGTMTVNAAGGNGGTGGNGQNFSGNGGTGGNGLALTANGATIRLNGVITGGNGASSGQTGNPFASGGAGGHGILVSGTGNVITVSGAVTGGIGGSRFGGGDNGAGGAGILMTGTGGTIIVTGSVTGGDGPTSGGMGINANTNATVVVGGNVTGGMATGPNTRASAVNFNGGVNTLELRAGWSLTGNVTGQTAADTLRLGGNANESFDMTKLAVQLAGFGILEKAGTSTWTTTGISAFSGPVRVNGGKLLVNNDMSGAASVTVNAGGTLGGTGTAPATTVNAGGALSPGASVGTLAINGNLTLNAGAATIVEVQGASIDRINVTGTTALNGALQLVALGGSYVFSSPYTFLTSTGAITGRFSSISTDSAFGVGVTSNVTYNAGNVQLTLTPAPLAPIITQPASPAAPAPLAFFGATGNSFAVASGIDRAVANGANPSAFFSLYNQPTRQALAAALNQLTGEAHTGANGMALGASGRFMGMMLNPFSQGRDTSVMNIAGGGFADAAFASTGSASARIDGGLEPLMAQPRAPQARFAVWGGATGGSSRMSGDALGSGAASLRGTDGHLAVGADIGLLPGVMAGFAFSGGETRATLANGQGSARADAYQAGLYALGKAGALSFGISGAYSSLDVEAHRAVPVLGLASVRASYRTEAWSGRMQADYAAFRWSGISLAPMAALQAQSVTTPGFIERNGLTELPVGIISQGTTNMTARGELGLKLDVATTISAIPVLLNASAAWGHHFARDNALNASLVGLAGSGFRVQGARPDKDSTLLGASAQISLGRSTIFAANFDSEISRNSQSYAGSARLKVAF